jgi:hypothetical protein
LFLPSKKQEHGGIRFDGYSKINFGNFLGIIISKPLELKIFEKEVNKQLNTIIQRKKQLQGEMNGRILQQSGPFETEKKQISENCQYQKSYDSASVELEKEILGKQSGLTSGKEGFGPNAKRKQELKEQRRQDLENYQKQVAPRLEYLDKEISKVYTNLKRRENLPKLLKINSMVLQQDYRLWMNWEKFRNYRFSCRFYYGTFICLEISPVLVKLISRRTLRLSFRKNRKRFQIIF